LHLKSLTLRGFKSFAKKTTLEFEPGVTMVVGPNGSGKSNITDAVLWVLGEQSPSNLRGNHMEDIIFSGTSNLKPLGLAEATLCLDNSDKTLPLEFNEITITRRMFKSGESDYLINGVACRLMDIQDLLSDSGLGRNTHSIIGQGKIEQIINSKPEERRDLIEEAAGVLKHKKRRQRALRKLVSADEKLTRIKDILRELNRQIKPLEKQASAAQNYTSLINSLKEKEIALNVQRLSYLQSKWSFASAKITKHQESVTKAKELMQDKEQSLEDVQQQLEKEGLFTGDIHQKLQCYQQLNGKLNSLDVLLTEKGRHQQERQLNINNQLDEAKTKLSRLEGEHKSFVKQQTQSQEELAKSYKALKNLQKQAEAYKKEYGQATNIAEIKKALDFNKSKLSNIVTSENKQITAISTEENRLQMIAKQTNSYKTEIDELKKSLSRDEKQQAGLVNEISKIEENTTEFNLKIEETALIKKESEEKKLEIQQKKAKLQAQIEALSSISSDNESGLSITDDIKIGRKGKNLLSELLTGTAIMDLTENFDFLSKLKQISLKGDIYADYQLKLSTQKEEDLTQKRQAIIDKITALDNDGKIIDADLATISKKIDNLEEDKARHQELLRTKNSQLQLILAHTEHRKNNLLKTEKQFESSKKEQNIAILSKEQLEKALIDLSKEKVLVADEVSLLEEKIGEFVQNEQSGQSQSQEILSKINKTKLEISSLNQRLGFINSQLKQIDDSINSLKELLLKTSTSLFKTNSNIEILNKIKAELDWLKRLSNQLDGQLKQIVADKGEQDSKLREQTKTLRQELQGLKDNFEQDKTKLESAKIDKAQIEVKVNDLADHIVNQFQISLETAIKDYASVATSAEEVKLLKEKIASLGPINEMALDEYDSLKERQTFLNSQIEDLMSSKKSLNKVVKAIDCRIKDEMIDSFEKVNGFFKQTFTTLFPGGTASLVLTDKEDIFNTGIEIQAQPAGKNVRRLSLLSGGETALTALALLFAIYHTRPSPFYILDEVEAALDDINLQRFIHLLEEMKTQTQFLIITHQRRTMEMADCLYGVSMRSNGVSTVISQKLTSIEKPQEQLTAS